MLIILAAGNSGRPLALVGVQIMNCKRLALAACLLMLSFPGLAASSGTLDDGYRALLKVERETPPQADPGPALRNAFAKHFGHVNDAAIDELSNNDLKIYFNASRLVVFFTRDPSDLALLESAFLALESRGLATRRDVETLFGAYVRLRSFDRASELAMRYREAGLEPLPRFSGLDDTFDRPTVLELQGKDLVSRVAVGVPSHGPYVVVAAHPLCHFSADAVRAIQQHPEIADLFKGRTLWLMPQDGQMNIDVVRDWNREYPDYAMRWAYRTSDWPMIKRWATPNFYFYRDGELVDTVIGWPPEGNREALLAAFARIGLSPDAGTQLAE